MTSQTQTEMDKKKLIRELDKLTTKWVKEHNLFKGGCAYSAAVLARELSNAEVDYEIVVFDTGKLDPIPTSESCKHMGITVKVGRKKMYIGGEPDFRYKIKKTNLGKIRPEVLIAYYEKLKSLNQWNSTYCSKKNYVFSLMCSLVPKQQEHSWAKLIQKILNHIFF